MKALYQSIRTRIESSCPSIKWVRLFNNQFERSNNDDPSQNDEQAFPYPCCFIEFPSDNIQTSSGYGSKRLEVLIRVHVGFESYAFEDLKMFDIAQEVQGAIENYKTDSITPLTYEAQRMDYNHNNVYVYQFDFSTQYSDDSSYVKNGQIAAPSPLTLEATVDLDIDNIIIRTGDGS
jgi:hypothetical protein